VTGEQGELGGVADGSALLRHVVRRNRHDVVVGSTLTMVHQGAEALVPVVIGVVIDQAVETHDTGALVRWIAALAVLFVGLSAAGCVGTFVYERVIVRSGHEARMALVRRVLDPRGGAEATHLPGDLVSLASVDTNRIGEGMGAVLLAAGAVVGTVGTAALLLATSLQLGLVVLVGLPLVLVAVHRLSLPLEERSGAQHEAIAAASGVATDLMSGLRVLKGLGAQQAAAARYRQASGTALDGALHTARWQGAYEGLTFTMGGAFVVVVAWFGGRLALDGDLTVGQLVAALGLTQFLVGPLNRVAYVVSALAQARAAATRIAAVCAAPPAVDDGSVRLPAAVRGDLRLRVASGHGDNGSDGTGGGDGASAAIADGEATNDGGDVTGDGDDGGFVLHAAAGEVVGIVCRSPEDTARVLAAFDGAATSGGVTVDGVELVDVVLDDRRRALLVARHDAALFEDTVAENVAVAATASDIVESVLRAAAVDEVIETVDGGLDAEVGEDGRALSGGQRQRVALARALATDAPVLVLEDPLTAVDAVTEHRIAARLRELRAGGRTTVLVTSSPALLAVADRVVLVEGRRVVAEGDHHTLAVDDERYRTAVLS